MKIDETTKQQIKLHLKDYLDEIARKGKNGLYFNPTDPSDSTASLSIFNDGTQFKDFGNGGTYKGDIFTLYADINHLNIATDFMQIAEALAKKYNIDLKVSNEKTATEIKKEIEKPQKDFTDYYKKLKSANTDTEATEYLKARFIDEPFITKYNILYDDYKKQIVIPVNNNYYKGRNIDPEKIKQYGKHYNPSGATPQIWNLKNLQDSDINTIIYLTESITDSISIEYIDPSKKTLALNSTAYKDKLYSAIKQYDYKGIFILCLDTDETGIKASADIKKELDKMGIYAFICNKQYNDYGGEWKETEPNIKELTIKDFNELVIKVKGNKDFLTNYLELAEEEARDDYKKYIYKDFTPTSEYIKVFEDEIENTNIYRPTPTNIKLLDNVLNGGLFAKQIITLIADTSIGKTAFALQIADSIAKNKPVLYFSLEMSQSELIARSISRFIGQWNSTDPDTLQDIKFSQIDLLQGKQYETTTGRTAYETAKAEYIASIKDNLFIYECLEDKANTITEIENKINKFIAKTNSKPIVFIDYLQYIDPDLKNATDKQAIDKIIRELKKIARTQAINIFVISSTARNNYNQETTLASGKNSGDIEFTSDIVIGLNLEAVQDIKQQANGKLKIDDRKKIKKASKTPTRDIYLSILKNRNGKRDIDIKDIQFTPQINYFDFSKAHIE